MKTFNKYNNQQHEELFLKLVHLDELEIKFELIKFENILLYYYKNICLFFVDKINQSVYINLDEIWYKISNTMPYDEDVYKFMNSMINKYFNFDNYKIFQIHMSTMKLI